MLQMSLSLVKQQSGFSPVSAATCVASDARAGYDLVGRSRVRRPFVEVLQSYGLIWARANKSRRRGLRGEELLPPASRQARLRLRFRRRLHRHRDLTRADKAKLAASDCLDVVVSREVGAQPLEVRLLAPEHGDLRLQRVLVVAEPNRALCGLEQRIDEQPEEQRRDRQDHLDGAARELGHPDQFQRHLKGEGLSPDPPVMHGTRALAV